MKTAVLLSAAVLALAVGPGLAQAPAAPAAQTAPAAPSAPGRTTEIVGPDGAFRLTPDGKDWERFQTVRSIGVACTKAACGEDRVFCLIQVRSAPDARPGRRASAEAAKRFGDGVLASAPKEMTASYIQPFAPRDLGPNVGQWADAKAEGEPGSIRFGLFLVEAKAQEVAMNCVAPTEKWDAYRPKIEAVAASLVIAP